MAEDVKTLERGSIYFFYRPKTGEEHPQGINEVQRTYFILSPDNKTLYRLAVMGQKKMPDPSEKGHGRHWGFIDLVEQDPRKLIDALGRETRETKTRGERIDYEARPAAEGRYRIVHHNDHTHLVYELELPEEPGDVQNELQIEPEASYIITIANPERRSPPQAGLSEDRKPQFPRRLNDIFAGRKFIDAEPPDFLDYDGCEFILIAASDDIKKELGIEIETEEESIPKADIFQDLKLKKSERPLEPLIRGQWE